MFVKWGVFYVLPRLVIVYVCMALIALVAWGTVAVLRFSEIAGRWMLQKACRLLVWSHYQDKMADFPQYRCGFEIAMVRKQGDTEFQKAVCEARGRMSNFVFYTVYLMINLAFLVCLGWAIIFAPLSLISGGLAIVSLVAAIKMLDRSVFAAMKEADEVGREQMDRADLLRREAFR